MMAANAIPTLFAKEMDSSVCPWCLAARIRALTETATSTTRWNQRDWMTFRRREDSKWSDFHRFRFRDSADLERQATVKLGSTMRSTAGGDAPIDETQRGVPAPLHRREIRQPVGFAD
jgi:hypothetical protein